MYSIRIIGLISVLAGGALSQAQQLKTVTATPADVKPTVSDLSISGHSVTDLHLRPLFTTTIRLPEPVTSVAVGAPTLFEVEHSDQEPRLVFVKPSTKQSATSNLVIALESGQEISMRLLSDGDGGNTPVDFVVNYRPPQSFLVGSSDVVAHSVETARDEKPRTVATNPHLSLVERYEELANKFPHGLSELPELPEERSGEVSRLGVLGPKDAGKRSPTLSDCAMRNATPELVVLEGATV